MSGTTVGWGILGTGWIAERFVADLLTAGHLVVAVGSRTSEAADAFATRHGIPVAHGSYRSLVEDPDVDAVYIATPHPYHARNALLAIEHGKHVLIEKPFTLTRHEAEQVLAAARGAGVVALEAMWTRYLPHMARIRRIIADGTIGDVRSVIAEHGQLLPTDPGLRFANPELGGGALLDLGSYPISFAIDLLGPPTRITALGSLTGSGVDRRVSIAMEHAGQAHSLSHAALDAAGPITASIIGTDGRIDLDRVWYAPTSFTVYSSANDVVARHDDRDLAAPLHFEAAELERCVRDGLTESPLLPAAQILGAMEVLDEVRRQIGLRYPGEG